MASVPPDSALRLSALPLIGTAAKGLRSSKIEEDVVALFDRFRSPLFRYLLAFRVSAPDAEEIVQEVFLALFRHLREGKSRANLQGWIFRVAHNLALKNRQRAQRESFEPPEAPIDWSPGPEMQAAEEQRYRRLQAVFRALPEQDRCCLSLRAEGLRYREIADVLGISLGAVANSMERSLARLNRADRCGETSADARRRTHAAK
jgi:RNA polymerase sigma-70 factor (ECF subfamily)